MNETPARANAAKPFPLEHDPDGTATGTVCAALALAVLMLVVPDRHDLVTRPGRFPIVHI
jgi:hypothetical protein